MGAADRPFSEVLKSIFVNIEDIIRSEMKLAQTEVREEIAKSTRGIGWFAAGLISALFALGFLLVAVFFALLFVVPDWAAAVLIATALGLISAVTFQICVGKRKTAPERQQAFVEVPQQEDLSWAKHQAR